MTTHSYKDEPAYIAGFMKEFDSEKHPRDERGRWARAWDRTKRIAGYAAAGLVVAGIAANIIDVALREMKNQPDFKRRVEQTYYHGTSASFLSSIAEHGLTPGKEGGADDTLRGGLDFKYSMMKIGTRKASVYITENQLIAQAFAEAVAGQHRSYPVILRIRIPEEVKGRLIPDKMTHPDMRAYRLVGNISPEWIESVKHGHRDWEDLHKRSGQVFYVVVPIIDATNKAYTYEDAYFAGFMKAYNPARISSKDRKVWGGILRKDELAYILDFMKAWDESKHPRGARGRFALAEQSGVGGGVIGIALRILGDVIHGKIFGTSKAGDLWHGTSSEALKTIKQQGLIPGKREGTDVHTARALQSQEMLDFLRFGDRKASVYTTSSWHIARIYAKGAEHITGSKPVIVRVRIPNEMRDEKVLQDERGGTHQWRYVGKIPPEWIDEYRDGNWVSLVKSDVHIVYTVIPIVDPLKKMVPYAEAKPYRNEDAYIAGRTGASDGKIKADGLFSERASLRPSGPDQRGMKDPKRQRLAVADMSTVERPARRTGHLYDNEAPISGDDMVPGSRLRASGRPRTL